MKKQITAIITSALILGGLTACSDRVDAPGSVDPQNVNISESSDTSDSFSESSDISDSSSESSPSKSTPEFINPYEGKYPFIDKRGVYGETEIPDFHVEETTSEGCGYFGPYRVAMGLESMEFETLTFGDYTIKLVGSDVRTDKESFPGKIFVSKCFVEITKDGEEPVITGISGDVTGFAGAQYQPGELLLVDKIGSYLDVYDMELPVLAMRYYFGDNPERLVHKAVDFAVLKDGEWYYGFVAESEPGCGVYWDWEQSGKPRIDEKINVPNEHFTLCRAALFEADEFTLVNKNTLADEEASITYTFKFSDPLQFELYTAEKNVGSVAASSEQDWLDGVFTYN
ncbi:MAG: hypothetical protein K2N56_03570 [Oscillospiraceae bacterium]|nr:hypothetical protein [Oscillospiraceae bacterium]